MRSICNTAASPPTGLLCNVSVPAPLPSGGGPSPLWGEDSHKRGGNPRIAALRQVLARLETAAPGAKTRHLPLGVPDMHAHLQGPGLACGVLHEVAAAAYGDRPAAFGFVLALTAAALAARPGVALFIASHRALADLGALYGHGLAQLGLDVGRLLLIETRSDKDALWALEDSLRSGARPAMVAGAIANGLDLTSSRRLNLAAAPPSTPLVLLRASNAAGVSAAATRWRIATAPAARDRFGAFASPRWHVALERCRNGRPGHWLVEWNHVAHRFRLVEVVADRAPVARAGLRRAG
jgi:protein ImuA